MIGCSRLSEVSVTRHSGNMRCFGSLNAGLECKFASPFYLPYDFPAQIVCGSKIFMSRHLFDEQLLILKLCCPFISVPG